MNITPINTLQQTNNVVIRRTNLKQAESKNISFGWECRGGYYSTPRGGCASSVIGVILGIGTALLAAPAGLIASTLAVTGGGIVGGTAGKIIGNKFNGNHNTQEKALENNVNKNNSNVK